MNQCEARMGRATKQTVRRVAVTRLTGKERQKSNCPGAHLTRSIGTVGQELLLRKYSGRTKPAYAMNPSELVTKRRLRKAEASKPTTHKHSASDALLTPFESTLAEQSDTTQPERKDSIARKHAAAIEKQRLT